MHSRFRAILSVFLASTFVSPASFAAPLLPRSGPLSPPSESTPMIPAPLTLAPPAVPTVIAISVPMVTRGETRTVTLTGNNLTTSTVFFFGPGIVPQAFPPPTVIPGGASMTLTVKVAADAPLGLREIVVVVNGNPAPTGVKVSVADAPVALKLPVATLKAPIAETPTPSIKPFVPATPPVATRPPVTETKPPIAGTFPPVSAIKQPAATPPAPGLRPLLPATPGRVVGKIEKDGAVDNDARRAVPDGIKGVRAKAESVKPQALRAAIPAAGREKAAGLKLDLPGRGGVPGALSVASISPDKWESGKSHKVTIFGAGFVNGMELSFGDGVAVKDLVVLSDKKAVATIAVDGAAGKAGRAAMVKVGTGAWRKAGASAWSVGRVTQNRADGGVLAKPDLLTASAENFAGLLATPLEPEVVWLVKPFWGKSHVEIPTDYGIPILSDETTFEWKEKSPGAAEWFEVRIYDKAGKVVGSQRINGGTVFHPDPAFITDMLAGIPNVKSSAFTTVRDGLMAPNSAAALGKVNASANASGKATQKAGGAGEPVVKSANERVKAVAIAGAAGGEKAARAGSGTILGAPVDRVKNTSMAGMPKATDAIKGTASAIGTSSAAGAFSGPISKDIDFWWEVAGYRTVRGAAPPPSGGSSSTPAPSQTSKKSNDASTSVGPKGGEMLARPTLTKKQGGNLAEKPSGQTPPAPAQTETRKAAVSGSVDYSKSARTDLLGSGPPVDVLVAVSEKWPLQKPKNPTGMACDAGTAKMSIENFPTRTTSDGGKDVNKYVGDFVVLSGSFSLGAVPWAVQVVEKSKAPGQGMIYNQEVESYSFNNLFIDWGDGTAPKPVRVQAVGGAPYSPTATIRLPGYNEQGWLQNQHVYKSPGTFPIRIYLLPEDDLGNLGALAASNAGGSTDPSVAKSAKDAYLVYCSTIPITTVKDLVATGPLHLDSTEVVAFAGAEEPPASMKDSLGKAPTKTSDAAAKAAVKGAAGPATGPAEKRSGSSSPMGMAPSSSSLEKVLAPPATGTARAGSHSGTIAGPLSSDAAKKAIAGGPGGALNATDSKGVAKASAGMTDAVKNTKFELNVSATVSACDTGLVARAKVGYYGQGRVRLNWFLDGKLFSSEEKDIGPSTSRTNLKYDEAESETGVVVDSVNFNSPLIGVSEGGIGVHSVSVSAAVVPDLKYTRFDFASVGSVAAGLGLEPVGAGVAGRKRAERKESAPGGKGDIPPRTIASPIPKPGIGATPMSTPMAKQTPPPGGAMPMSFSGGSTPIAMPMSVPAMAMGTLPPGVKIGLLNTPSATISGTRSAVTYLAGSGGFGDAFARPAGAVPADFSGFGVADAPIATAEAGATLLAKPNFVSSEKLSYLVTGNTGTDPCQFRFPTADGKYFVVGNLKGNVKADGTRYSGYGTMMLLLSDGPSSAKPYPALVHFSDWEIPDGVTVKSGTIDSKVNLKIEDLPGLVGKITRLDGTAGDALNATIELTVSNDSIRSADNTQKPHSWKPIREKITPSGDWIATGQSLPNTLLGWSSFRLDSDAVTLDLSRSDGTAGDPKCMSGGGKAYVGVHLGPAATLYPYVMDLATVTTPVKDWGIVTAGVCGSTTVKSFDAPLGPDGATLHFDSIAVNANRSTFTAAYQGLKIKAIWPDVTLEGGNAVITEKSGEGGATVGGIKFNFETKVNPVETYGPITMTAKNLAFDKTEIGWGIIADAVFDFRDGDNKPFASVPVNKMIYSMGGRAFAPQGKTTLDVPLSIKGWLGGTRPDVVSSRLAFVTGGDDLIRFSFQTKVAISKTLPETPAQVDYTLRKGKGKTHAGVGPVTAPFTVELSFPPGNPKISGGIKPEYSGGAANPSNTAWRGEWGDDAGDDPPALRFASLLDPNAVVLSYDGYATDAAPPLMLASNGSNAPRDTFVGSVDLQQMLGAPMKITADFRLGMAGDQDYWLVRTNIELPTPVPIFTDVFLTQLGGGVSYNFAGEALLQPATALASIQPTLDGNYVFMANAVVTDGTQFIFTVKGALIIETKNPPFMDVKAWLLESVGDVNAPSPINGRITFGSDGFRGIFTGHYELLNGHFVIDGTADVWFGAGFHIWLGTPESPVQATATFLGLSASAGAYFQLGTDSGYRVGAIIHSEPGIGDCDDVCVRVVVDLRADAGITLNPLQMWANGSAGAGIKLCALGECVSKSRAVGFRAGYPPVTLQFSASIGLPCPLPDFGFWVQLLPSPDGGIDLDWCDFGLF